VEKQPVHFNTEEVQQLQPQPLFRKKEQRVTLFRKKLYYFIY